jgi:hydrogenase expression/formation protein HypC
MCLAVPAEVVEIESQMALCRMGEGQTSIKASLLLMDEEVAVGDYLLIHAGFALRRLDVEEAKETLRLMREMASKEEGFMSWGQEDA